MATIEQLQRRILELESKLKEQTDEMAVLMEKSRKAVNMALHAYKLDAYGYLWVWSPEDEKYHRTKMRVMSPEIVDRAIHAHHIADGAITGDKIEDGEVIPGKLANDAVATRNIQDKAVTHEKLSDELLEDLLLSDVWLELVEIDENGIIT